MKIIISVILLFLFSLPSAWALPECEGSPHKRLDDYSKIKHWNNCKGTVTLSDGRTKLVAEFKDGRASGKGTVTFPDGNKYVGELKDGMRHGHGTFTWSKAKVKYEGEWKYNNKVSGTETYSNGNKYVGEWKDNKYNGQGIMTYGGGGKYEGEWKNNKKSGQGTETYPDGFKSAFGILTYGGKYVGEWKDNEYNGQGTFYFHDGRVWEGQFKDKKLVRGNKYAAHEYKGPKVANTNKNDYESDKLVPAASGSGFIISELGHIVSNNHVIQGCERVKAHHKGKAFEAIILATDTINDLALLQIDFSPSTVFSISQNSTELMQDVFVAGYPFGVSISSSVKVTRGIVSSLAGIGNNYSNMQIDAALQPGNSGGPILDEKGNVLGVAVSKLDLGVAMKKFGVVPEGTNFGIKSSVLKNFLQSNSVDLKTPMKDKISRSELSKKITDGTLFLSCWMTYAQIEKLKTQKVMFKDLQ